MRVRGVRVGGVRARGAALLMALFIAAIATTIVTGLFWRQFVLVRTIDNEQLMTQSRLLLRAALDWADTILREDAATTPYDALTQPWAQPLADTKLDQLGESSSLASQASMSGGMEDAQGRFNLTNLVNPVNGVVQPDSTQHDVLARLATELSLPEPTADLITAYMVESFSPIRTPTGVAPPASQKLPLPLVFPEDLRRVPGLDPAAGAVLAPYVVVLGSRMPVNFNTASAELIAAEIPGMSLSVARAMVADRDRVPFIKVGDIQNWLTGRLNSQVNLNNVASVSSTYFFVRGEIKLQRADTRIEALVQRSARGQTGPITILWEREL
jgi:general secretion pathway protein K